MTINYERFHRSYRINTKTGCWEWIKAKHRQGYGWFHIDGRNWLAHRASWFMRHLFIPPRKISVCHSCDNPSCVNPEHLFIGSQRDNVLDCIAKGRANRSRPVGSKNPMAVFSEAQVRRILRDNRKQRDIAREYECAESTISMIKRGKNWPHLYAEWQSHEATKRQEMRL